MDTVNKAIPHATESLASVSNVASLLQQNAIQDYLVYIKVCAAMRRGVFSTQQWATMIVHSYPFFPSLETFLDSIDNLSLGLIKALRVIHPSTALDISIIPF
ncbi:hypothetical protein WJX79_005204 [Trebouxia sp. C0005]